MASAATLHSSMRDRPLATSRVDARQAMLQEPSCRDRDPVTRPHEQEREMRHIVLRRTPCPKATSSSADSATHEVAGSVPRMLAMVRQHRLREPLLHWLPDAPVQLVERLVVDLEACLEVGIGHGPDALLGVAQSVAASLQRLAGGRNRARPPMSSVARPGRRSPDGRRPRAWSPSRTLRPTRASRSEHTQVSGGPSCPASRRSRPHRQHAAALHPRAVVAGQPRQRVGQDPLGR